jgi:hypothetical protein
MPDPHLTTAREVLRRTHGDMRRSIEGLPPEALNWCPAAYANSIAVLAGHSLKGARYWLAVALGAPPPDRDRPAEFHTEASSVGGLLDLVDDLVGDCLSLLNSASTVDWSVLREIDPQLQPRTINWPALGEADRRLQSQNDQPRLTAAWCFTHALEHLREHEGQMSLTRQLWEQRES